MEDWNPNHFSFVRQSRLPQDVFSLPRNRIKLLVIALIAFVMCPLIVILLAWSLQ